MAWCGAVRKRPVLRWSTRAKGRAPTRSPLADDRDAARRWVLPGTPLRRRTSRMQSGVGTGSAFLGRMAFPWLVRPDIGPRRGGDFASQAGGTPLRRCSFSSASLGHALGVSGDARAAAEVMSALQNRSESEYVPPYSLALICCGIGHESKALEYLACAVEERYPAVALWFRGEPRLDPLRGHTSFERLLQTAGLA